MSIMTTVLTIHGTELLRHNCTDEACHVPAFIATLELRLAEEHEREQRGARR